MNVSNRMALKMLAGGIRNRVAQRPLSVSFEITHYCTANCWHCNWGGPVTEEQRLGAEDYARICRELMPVVSHISGGEPLARTDVYDIVRAMANPGSLPFMVIVSNAAALTLEKYHKLREAGIHQFSISLDFPDERHSEFRRIPRLFEKMSCVIPEITALGHGDLSLNVCITKWNFRDLAAMVEVAARWNTQVNFSVYTPLRTDDGSGLPPPELHDEARAAFRRVIEMRKEGWPVYTSERVMWQFFKFFTGGTIAGCQAGRRFLVINPDGKLVPCAMVWAKYDVQAQMLREFTAHNTCEACFISTRASTEKTIGNFVADSWELLMGRSKRKPLAVMPRAACPTPMPVPEIE